MAESILSLTTRPLCPYQNEPRAILFDPSRHIRNPATQLYPFGEFIEIRNEIGDLVHLIQNSQYGQLFLILVFSAKDDTAVKRFIMKHLSNHTHLFSLFLIFPNGVQYHERWICDPTIPKLRWCRSFTAGLIRDILDACKSACDQRITFCQQRMIQAEDAIERNSIDATPSLAIFFANKLKEYSNLLSIHLKLLSESDN